MCQKFKLAQKSLKSPVSIQYLFFCFSEHQAVIPLSSKRYFLSPSHIAQHRDGSFITYASSLFSLFVDTLSSQSVEDAGFSIYSYENPVLLMRDSALEKKDIFSVRLCRSMDLNSKWDSQRRLASSTRCVFPRISTIESS